MSSILDDLFGDLGKDDKATITLPISQAKADQATDALGIIAKKLSVEELKLLAKALEKPFLKAKALEELKNYV